MSVNVRIPTILRTYTGDRSQVEANGSTLTEVIDSLDSDYPGIKARIVDEEGALRRFVNIYVKEEDVRFAQGLDTQTPAGTQISIIPAVAGGA
ncbi:MAG TPA: MoaD/ThiS family protein [Aeromicrobium sp.]|nr:MoaD/ThiS family protein [Aeromicrobium sp.]